MDIRGAAGSSLGAAPAPRFHGWGAVLVLVLAYAVSFVDRQVIGLLVEPIRHDLKITDTQIGMLQGPAFGLFYAVAGLPLGWLADRTHRVRLIAAGILLWSAMTMAGGLATSFIGLFLARVGVGVGEAALVPAAVSLLADLFPPHRRALPLSVFTAGVSLGVGLALVLGGVFVGFAAHGVRHAPLVGGWLASRRPWQAVFFMAGSLGLPVAAAVLTLTEPRRRSDPPAASQGRQLAAYLRAHWRLFAPLLAGAGVIYLFTNALPAWAPTLFIRKFCWVSSTVGVRLGVLITPCALAGSVMSGLVATALARRDPLSAPLRTMLVGSGLLAPLAVAGTLAGSAGLALAGVVGMYFAFSLCFGVASATFVAATPSRLRGQMVALYLLVGNLIGLGLGPLIVGLLLDHLPGGPEKVGVALSAVGAASVIPGFLLLSLAFRFYAPRVAAIRSQEGFASDSLA